MTEDKEFKERELIPVRMLDEYIYCPRLAYYEMVYGEFVQNEHTIEGKNRHVSVDAESGAMPIPEEFEKNFRARAVTLSDEDLGIISKLDIVEGKNGEVSAVEIKKGSGPDSGAWPADITQIAAQTAILIANGYKSESGFIYYSASNKKVEIPYTADVEKDLVATIYAFREMLSSNTTPAPLVDSNKCNGCSLAGICLPDETLFAAKLTEDEDIRCLYPARDDSIPLVVQTQGMSIGKSGEEFTIKKYREVLGRAKIIDVSSVNIYGNIQITAQALNEMISREIPVCHFSYGGWFRAMTTGMPHKNVHLRIKQFEIERNKEERLKIAKSFVLGKVKNSRTLLRRNCKEQAKSALDELSKLIEDINKCKKEEALLGIEGNAARIYFGNLAKMIKSDIGFDFKKRNRRPPKDPVNAILSFCYSMLARDMTIAAMKTGFDPYLGFYHKPRYGRPALALDLMEEFRPIVADSVVISAINNGEVKPDDFITRGPSCTMTGDGRKKIISVYERRMNDLVTHPVFKYRVSYRRIFEIQTRMLARYVMGEIEELIPFVTR